jgi:hypothetical protein
MGYRPNQFPKFPKFPKFPQDEWDDIDDTLDDINDAKEELADAAREMEEAAREVQAQRDEISRLVKKKYQQMQQKQSKPVTSDTINGFSGWEDIMGDQAGSWSKSVKTVNGRTEIKITKNGKVIHHSIKEEPTAYTEFVKKPVVDWFKKINLVIDHLLGKKETKNEAQKEAPKEPEADTNRQCAGDVYVEKNGL